MYKSKIDQLINQLNTPAIKVLTAEYKFLNSNIDDRVLKKDLIANEWYSEIDFLRCKWIINDNLDYIKFIDKERDIISGQVNILSRSVATEYQMNFQKYLNPFHLISETELSQLASYLPFDYLPDAGAACFKTKETGTEQLYWIDFADTGQIINLKADVKTYVSEGLASAFFYGWQRAFLLSDKNIAEKIIFYNSQLIQS